MCGTRLGAGAEGEGRVRGLARRTCIWMTPQGQERKGSTEVIKERWCASQACTLFRG